jgi:hypothetical protein
VAKKEQEAKKGEEEIWLTCEKVLVRAVVAE